MVSQDKERVVLGPNLKARGSLEDWLTQVEDAMRKCLHKMTKAAMLDLGNIGVSDR